MTIFQNEVVNPEKPWAFMKDTKENILKDLEQYALDPTFEEYGNFINKHPTWKDKATADKYKGMTMICGNFMDQSHAFRLLTDNEDLIKELETAIRKNQKSEAYAQAKIRLEQRKAEEKKLRDAYIRKLNRNR